MKLKPGFEVRDICGKKVIMAYGIENIDFSKLISVNETANFIFNSLGDKPFDVASVVDKVCQEYDVDRKTATKDVEALFAQWKNIGLIED